jgi:branched-chain amino acid transport system substrate-binding protein
MDRFVGSFKWAACLVLAVLFIAFPLTGYSKDKILIGNAISLSGPYAPGAASTQIPPYDMWVKEINEQGGLYVKEYDKKLPIELIRYDDKSDIGTMVKLVEKLILEDKVDLMFPPWGTAMNFAAAKLATKYKYPMLGVTVDSLKLAKMAPEIPYFFIPYAQPPVKMRSLVAFLKELGVKTAVIIHNADLHGIEYAGYTAPLIKKAGIKLLLNEGYPLGAKDLSPLLKKVKALNPDAFLGFSYPDETWLITRQSMEIGFNPKLFALSIGTFFYSYRDSFGANVIQGVMGMSGAWSPKQPFPGAKEFWDRMVKFVGGESKADMGTAGGWQALQVLQQAIEKAGTLDRPTIRSVLATDTFMTVEGPVKFKNQINEYSPGEIFQWQNGQIEVVGSIQGHRTAKAIYPKPPWP